MIKAQLVALGARIPSDLKKKVASYCDRNGIKLQFFIMEAIQSKLEELQQDTLDNAVAEERLKYPQFSTKEELSQYIAKRKKNS